MASVIHTADTHLGYKQYHQPERVTDFANAFTQVIDAAINSDVDAIIHAGDLFHDSRPNTETILTAIQQLRHLKANTIPFLMVVGNHEDTHESQWADIFEEMNLGTRLSDEPITIDNTAFYGMDYTPTTRRAELDYQFPDHDSEYAALVAHGGFQPLSMHDDWNAEHVLGDSNITFDAFLLGDDHTPKTETLNGTLTTYPGSTERTAHDQRTDRVYNELTFGGFTDGVQINQETISTRDFVYIDELELDETATPRVIRDAIDTHNIEDAVVIVTIDGDGEPFTTADLEQYILDQDALVARVRDARTLDTTDADVDVSFADPDDAVEQRIRDLELSVVGHDLDTTVRDVDGVAESNLSDEIKQQIDDRVDDEPADFNTEPDLDPLPDPDDTTDASDDPAPKQETNTADTTETTTTDDGDNNSKQQADSANSPQKRTDGGAKSDTNDALYEEKREKAEQALSELTPDTDTDPLAPVTTTTSQGTEQETQDAQPDHTDTDSSESPSSTSNTKLTDF